MAKDGEEHASILRLILTRLIAGILLLLVVSAVVFFVTQALPGDVARAILGQNATAEQLARLREQLGLDQPVFLQYLHWLGDLLTGNWGVSLASGTPVSQLLAVRVGNSATVVLLAAIVVLPVGIVLGSLAARRAGGVLDNVVSWSVQLILSLPEFVVGILLMVVLANGLHLLPPTSPLDPRLSAWQQPQLLVLPVATMILIALPHLTEAAKTVVRDELGTAYIRWGRLSGISPRRLLWGQALPRSSGPIAQVSGVTINYLLGGIVAVEVVFSFPGIGSELVDAVASRDIPIVQAIAMGIATILLITFLIADVVAVAADPRKGVRR